MQACDAKLTKLLNEEDDAMRSLLQLIKHEQALLLAAEIDGLTALTEQKAEIVARMAALANRRHQLLAAEGFAPSEAGMQTWLDSNVASGAQKRWMEMRALIAAAQELNRTNGLLINRHMTRNQSALNILQGGASQAGGFYGPNGQATQKAAARSLVIG